MKEERRSIKPNGCATGATRGRRGGEAGGELSEIGDEADMTFSNEKEALRAHGLEDTGDVKVRAKMTAGTALVRLKQNIFRVFGGLQEEKRQIE